MIRCLSLLLCIIPLSFSQAANYYWVGGSGDWTDAASHWATSPGGSTFHTQAPGPNDNVFFDGNSFPGAGQTVTVGVNPANCLNMDWTGVGNKPKLLITASGVLDIYGDLTLVAGMGLEFAAQFSSRIRMQATTVGKTVTTAGQDMVNLRFEGSGSWILQDALMSSSELFVTGGSLDANDQDITASTFFINNSGVSLDLSNSQVTASTIRIFSNPSVTLTNSTVTATEVDITQSGLQFNVLELTGNLPSLDGKALVFETLRLSGTTRTEIYGSHTINTLLSATESGSLVQVQAGRTLNINGNMESLGGSCADLITWRSDNSGVAFTISKSSGNVTVSNVIFQDIHGSGGASFTANSSVNLGNTTGWTINAPLSQTYFWIADNGGDWSNGNNWSLSTGGSPAGCTPTALDNVVFDANSFNSAAAQPVVLVDNTLQLAHDMSWSGVLNTPIMRIPSLTRLEIYGDLSLTPGMEIDFVTSSSSQLWMKAGGPVNIESAGLDLVNFRLDGFGGTFTLQDALTSSHELFIIDGTLDLDGFDLNARNLNISSSGAALDMADANVSATFQFRVSSISSLQTTNSYLTTNRLIIIPPFLTFNMVLINGVSGSISGTDLSFTDLTVESSGITTISGSHTISGELFLNNPGGTVEFQANRTISLGAFGSKAGDCGDQIRLISNNDGSVFTFDFTGASLPLPADNSFLILQDSRVLNGPFEVDASVDLGNTPGWVINPASSKHFFWIGNGGDWDDPSHWSLTSGGTSAKCIPTVNDDVTFDRNSFSAANQEVLVPSDDFHCRNMEWVGFGVEAITDQPTFRLSSLASLYIHGSLYLANPTQMTYAVNSEFGSKLWMVSRTPGQSIRTGGLDLINLRFDGEGGSWSLSDDLFASTELFLIKGALNVDGLELTGDFFSMSSGTSLSIVSSLFDFRRITLNSSNINATGSQTYANMLSANATGIILDDVQISGSDPTLSASGLNVNDLRVGGLDQISLLGNILVQGNLELLTAGSTVILGSGNTLEFVGDILSNALPGNRINIRSSTPGSQAFLRKTSGTVCLENLNIRDSDAGGGATFGAVNSTDEGNNSGWIFSADASCEIFLPVECADFRARLIHDRQINLEWTTWTEQNNRGFEVQRSQEATPFKTIAWIDGAGNSQQPIAYDFMDDQPKGIAGGTLYYRLLQIDQDGQENQTCDIVSIELEKDTDSQMRISPNPMVNATSLEWEQRRAGPVSITIMDAFGRPYWSNILTGSQGPQRSVLEVSDWPNGCYSIRLKLPDGAIRIGRLVVNH